MGSVKKLVEKVKVMGRIKESHQSHSECLLTREWEEEPPCTAETPSGFVAIYVGEERRRFVVAMEHLSHPLFKMLLEKAHHEFGFEQRNGLVVPCSVAAFREVVAAVERCRGRFDFGNSVEEFI
ncbi:hypothetical protein U1Q18_051596 [Sarracenia purpurea var. burkii]